MQSYENFSNTSYPEGAESCFLTILKLFLTILQLLLTISQVGALKVTVVLGRALLSSQRLTEVRPDYCRGPAKPVLRPGQTGAEVRPNWR